MVKDRVLNGRLAANLIDNRLLTLAFVLTALVKDFVAIDVTALFRDGLPTEDVHADHVMLVETFGPTLRNAIFHFILDHHLVGALSQGLSQRLLMELIKLVVELGNHLLDVSRFFFGVELLEDSDLNIVFMKHTLLHHRQERLRRKHVFYLSVLIATKQLHVSLIYLVDELWVQLHVR